MADKTGKTTDKDAGEARGKITTVAERTGERASSTTDPATPTARARESMAASEAAAKEGGGAVRELVQSTAEEAALARRDAIAVEAAERQAKEQRGARLIEAADRMVADARDEHQEVVTSAPVARGAVTQTVAAHPISQEARNVLVWLLGHLPDPMTFWPNSTNFQTELSPQRAAEIEELRAAGLVTVSVDGGATVVALVDKGGLGDIAKEGNDVLPAVTERAKTGA